MPADLFDLSGRTALVTGAARGLGRAIALGLARHGADLAAVDRDFTGAEEVVQRDLTGLSDGQSVEVNAPRK